MSIDSNRESGHSDGDRGGTTSGVGMVSPRSGMIWDGFQWHPAPNVKEAEDFRAHKYPPHLIAKAKEQAEAKKATVQQAAALQAIGTKLNTKYPPNPMNACPLVNPEIATACAAAAAAAGKLTPQQATILKLATVNKTAYLGAGLPTNTETI